MKKLLAVTVVFSLFIVSALAHDGVKRQDKGPFTLKKLTDDVYVLYGRGGNIGIAVTAEGVVVIDDQFADLAPGIAAQIKTISDKPVKFLINTHHHFDHTGGNEFFIKMTTIVAHDNVRKHMLAAPQETIVNQTARIERLEKQIAEAKDPQSKEVADMKGQIEAAKKNLEAARAIKISDVPAPNITFSREMRIYLGGKEIQVFHAKRGHTDGDSIIYFPKDKVAHLGDLFVNKRMPFIDRAHGASSAEWVETLDSVLSRIDPASQVIPGHGDAGTVADLRVFRQYLLDLREAVKQAIATGRTREQAVKEIQLPQYSTHTGYAQGLAGNVGVVYDEMKEGK